jgi:hypothetical protein
MASIDVSIHANVPARLLDRNGLRVREDVLYTDAKGREKSKLHKRADKVFDDLSDILRRVLELTETVFYIAETQIMPSAFVQFFGGGWHSYSIPRTVLFFTERRIIAFRLRKHMRGWIWDRGLREVRWGDLLDVVPGGFLARWLALKFRNGEKQAYWRFPVGDFKKIRLLIQILQPGGAGISTAVGGIVSLCPKCLATLAPRNYQCLSCGERFKDEKSLVWRGIVIPGGASLYVGASGLGVLRAAFETILLFGIFWSVLRAVQDSNASKAATGLFAAIAAECAVLVVDKLMAIGLSLPQIRDFIPVE